MKSKIVSMFLCIVMVVNISAAIIQNLGLLSMNASGAGGLADSPWPMIRQNLNHTGFSPYNTSTNPGKLRWSFTTGQTVWSFPSIGSDGTIYVGSCDNKLYAINPDGTQKWNFTTGKSIDSCPAIASDGTIYLSSDDHNMYAITSDGTEKWRFPTLDEVISSPAIGTDGTIYVGSRDRKLYAINPDGTEKWRFPALNQVPSSPAIASDGTIYVGSYDYKMYAINPDGTEKWNFTTGDGVDSSPAIGSDGTIYVGSHDYKLYAINSDGSQKWNFTTGSRVHSSPAIGSDGTIYVGSVDNNLYAINPDGTEKWSFMTGDKIYQSSPAIGSDGTIYIGSRDKNLYAINPDGTKKWNFTTGDCVDSSPAIGSDGTIYIGSSDNKLYAIGIPNTPPIADAGLDQIVNEGDIVQFNGSASYDPDGTIITYEWDFNASDGLWWDSGVPPDAKGPTPNHTYAKYGVFIVTLRVTDNDGFNDTDTCEIRVLLPPEPPTLYLNVSLDGNDSILYWDPPLIPGINHYLIYRSTSQTDFDFNIVWVNTSADNEIGETAPIPLRTMWNDTNAASPGNDTNYGEQFYYTIRAVNVLGEVSGTSRTVGKWTKTFPKGVSTFSLPLEPLKTRTTDYYLTNMNATYIKWMNQTMHTWMKYGEGGVNDTQMKMGEGYEVKFSNQTNYTFTGMPGAMISYDDDTGFLGFNPATESKNLTVSVEPNGNVTLTWDEPASMNPGDWYEVYYSNTRDGFFGNFNVSYFLVCPPVYFGNNTTIHNGALANNPGTRLYYMVVPFNATGVRGSSTYSIGVWTEEYLAQYDTIGIPLKLTLDETADWYCDNIQNTVGINYHIHNEHRWCWHSTRMPAGAFDPILVMTEGYQISNTGPTKFTFIGR